MGVLGERNQRRKKKRIEISEQRQLHLADLEHIGAALWALTLHAISAIGHLVGLGVFHLNLALTLHAVTFNTFSCCHGSILRAYLVERPPRNIH